MSFHNNILYDDQAKRKMLEDEQVCMNHLSKGPTICLTLLKLRLTFLYAKSEIMNSPIIPVCYHIQAHYVRHFGVMRELLEPLDGFGRLVIYPEYIQSCLFSPLIQLINSKIKENWN